MAPQMKQTIVSYMLDNVTTYVYCTYKPNGQPGVPKFFLPLPRVSDGWLRCLAPIKNRISSDLTSFRKAESLVQRAG
jgi:hypothetical protein